MINEIEWLQLKVENFAASALCSINLREWSATTITARDLPTIYWQESIVYVTLYNNLNSKYTCACHLPQEMTAVSLSDQLCSKFTPHYCYYPETKHHGINTWLSAQRVLKIGRVRMFSQVIQGYSCAKHAETKGII